MKIKYLLLISQIVWLLIFQTSCKKLVEVSAPVTTITGNSVYASDATAIAVLTAMYAKISNAGPSSLGSISSLTSYTGLSSDEFTLWSGVSDPSVIAYYNNALTGGATGHGSEFWMGIYPYIFSCNAAIEGLMNTNSITPAIKQQLLGEAKFMRGFFYFYLTNLYGNVALPLSSDYKINSTLVRSPSSQVYQQIISDLKESENLLSTNYLDATLVKSTIDRVRPTKWAAAALLARVFLYTGDFANAKAQADTVIENTALFGLSPLKKVFLKASSGVSEAIWQLQPVNFGWNTEDAKSFIIPPTGPLTGLDIGIYLSNNLLNSFEGGDQRRLNENWVDSIIVGGTTYYYPYKYTVNTEGADVTEYFMMLRLGELYLIRAEAKAQLGDLSGAAADVNSIRNRAGLGVTVASNQADLLAVILHERQVELFAELGQRWLDLKRTKSVDAIMNIVTPQKSGQAWQSYQQLYPVSYFDIQTNPKLTQNPGY